MNRIRELREKAKMKQSDLGRLLNVKDAAISKYETGKIPLKIGRASCRERVLAGV